MILKDFLALCNQNQKVTIIDDGRIAVDRLAINKIVYVTISSLESLTVIGISAASNVLEIRLCNTHISYSPLSGSGVILCANTTPVEIVDKPTIKCACCGKEFVPTSFMQDICNDCLIGMSEFSDSTSF